MRKILYNTGFCFKSGDKQTCIFVLLFKFSALKPAIAYSYGRYQQA